MSYLWAHTIWHCQGDKGLFILIRHRFIVDACKFMSGLLNDKERLQNQFSKKKNVLQTFRETISLTRNSMCVHQNLNNFFLLYYQTKTCIL
jgi:putative heme degradation protein